MVLYATALSKHWNLQTTLGNANFIHHIKCSDISEQLLEFSEWNRYSLSTISKVISMAFYIDIYISFHIESLIIQIHSPNYFEDVYKVPPPR